MGGSGRHTITTSTTTTTTTTTTGYGLQQPTAALCAGAEQLKQESHAAESLKLKLQGLLSCSKAIDARPNSDSNTEESSRDASLVPPRQATCQGDGAVSTYSGAFTPNKHDVLILYNRDSPA
ncbi:hypothetical protein L249_4148 [Ophiocordyceps polyrhachis-furcata BCC 54312]|uniref:Uncharacterized protein n=1 Tax=Ophiocordyceps polyrhachis-furcata BCC 54312 TaxID=1330021 RepID=A0A367L5A2_9HYPO|nr:hypothetical protein L249_4148 [Ophiocordyceps polyrhachis-furcata BCC 54312]